MTPALIPVNAPRSLAAIGAAAPALFVPNAKAAERFFEFFSANIRNKDTGRAYYRAACRCSERCEDRRADEVSLDQYARVGI